jgi:glycosyltransferase involved in cell wall biosynthesis
MQTDPTSPADRPEILALIPAYNEAERIVPVIQGAMEHLPVLVVDDGSRDATSQLAQDCGAQVLRLDPNQGKGAALKAGFRRAVEQGFKAVVTLDADGQHDTAEIPVFLHAWEAKGSDMIIGVRDFSKMPFPRRYSNPVGQWLFNWAVGRFVPDNQSGYRLFSRRLMEASLDSPVGGFEFEVEIIVICIQHGFSLSGVPIRTIYAGEGSHITPVRHVGRYFRLIWRTRKSMQAK